MKHKFVQTSNVTRFLAATDAVQDPGASEACFMLVDGDAGFGKSECGQWWAVRNGGVFLRVKAACTPFWILSDLVTELGEPARAHSCEKLFNHAIELLIKDPRPIVVDEVESALHDIRVLETLRDVSDLVEVPVIMLGREHVWAAIRKHNHFRSRISARASFGKATFQDVERLVSELCEVPVAADLIKRIEAESEGRVREIVKAIKNVERVGLRNKGRRVGEELMDGKPLCHDWQKRRAS